MKMKNLLITLLSILYIQAFTQPTLQWANSLNSSIANDQGNAIAVDANGNVYVTGSSDGNTGASDYLTIKYNPMGGVIWSRTYNGSASGIPEKCVIQYCQSGSTFSR